MSVWIHPEEISNGRLVQTVHSVHLVEIQLQVQSACSSSITWQHPLGRNTPTITKGHFDNAGRLRRGIGRVDEDNAAASVSAVGDKGSRNWKRACVT